MIERILIPLDGSKVGETALPYVEELVSKLAPGVKTEVTLLQVITPQVYFTTDVEISAVIPYTEEETAQIKKKVSEYLEKAGEGLRSTGITVNSEVRTGNAADEIIKVTQEINADLVAMSTHGRSGISRWALGSITDKVLRKGNIPVLVVRAPKETAKTQPPAQHQ